MLKKEFMIGKTKVGGDAKPYIIAEIGSNFDKNMEKARKLIKVAAEAGANAVKFQLFRAEVLYPDRNGLFELFKSIELDPDWVPQLNTYARENGLDFMASAFDTQSVSVLKDIQTPAFKVASSETTNLQLLHQMASFGKPMVISTGMCDMIDIQEAINVCKGVENNKVILMQCGAMYPLPPHLANLRVLETFSGRFFGCPVGFSDHTLGKVAATTAVGLGAQVFEKHITLDRNADGPDHFFALEPDELKAYVAVINEAFVSLGSNMKDMLPKEKEGGRREGIYFIRAMKKGEIITNNDIELKRPAVGLRTRYASTVNGAILIQDAVKGQPLDWKMISFGEK